MSGGRNEDEFKQWLAEHRGIVVKVAGSFADLPQDREDLTQEILLRIWSAMPSFRSEAKVSTWIYRIALNCALTWQRDERRSALPLSTCTEVVAPASGNATEEAEVVQQNYMAIRTLGEMDRSLMLMALDECSYQEMADVMGITVNHVGVRLNRAKKRLAELLRLDD